MVVGGCWLCVVRRVPPPLRLACARGMVRLSLQSAAASSSSASSAAAATAGAAARQGAGGEAGQGRVFAPPVGEVPRVPRPHNHIPIRQEDGVVRVLVTIATKRRRLRAARPKELCDFHHGDDGVRAKVHDPAFAVLKAATFVSSRGRDHFSVWVEKQRKAKAGNHKQTLQTNSQPRV